MNISPAPDTSLPTTMKALTFSTFGGPEVLRYGDVPSPALSPGTVIVETTAIGLNFADIYRRRGAYVLAGHAPWIAGYEGAGRIVATGENIDGWEIGQRVGFADVAFANASRVSVPVEKLISLPDDISDIDAASLLLQGLTAQYLIEDSVAIRPGDPVLVHAAAGGVGRLLIQFATARGARVYALASTVAKREAALATGAIAAFGYEPGWVEAVQEVTGGGVAFAYDSAGNTLAESIAALRPTGRAVIFGKAGGEPPVVAPFGLLEGSKGIIGGDLWTYLSDGPTRRSRAERLFDALRNGIITRPLIETFALSDGEAAHGRLEDRSFAGKIVLMP